jgi:hypothetical protein
MVGFLLRWDDFLGPRSLGPSGCQIRDAEGGMTLVAGELLESLYVVLGTVVADVYIV